MKPGNKGKGTDMLNQICRNRVPRKDKRHMKKAVKEKKPISEKMRLHMERVNAANAERRALEEANPELKKERLEKQKRMKSLTEEKEPLDDEPGDEEILTKQERQLRNDMLWVLEKLGGRETLYKMAKGSYSLQVLMWKELLKLEGKLTEARIKSKAPANQGAGFYFVLAGLNDIKKAEGLGHDMKFLGNALTPNEPIELEPYEEENKDEP